MISLTAHRGAPAVAGETTLAGQGADASINREGSIEALHLIEDDQDFERACAAAMPAFATLELLKVRVQRQIKRKDLASAVALIDAHEFESDGDGGAMLVKAELLHEAREHARAAELFQALIAGHPDRREYRAEFAKRLLAEGDLASARTIILPVEHSFSEGTKAQQLVTKTLTLYALLERLEGTPPREGEDARILAMKHAILRFRDRQIDVREGVGLGRLSLITGSLGPGGAERQLTRLAIELNRLRMNRGEVAGVQLDRPVEVLVRSHGPERQNDFYLAELQASGCELQQINLFDPVSAKVLGVTDPELLLLLDYLPPAVNYGVKRLARHLRESGTETASIWQDGACLFAGLAALVAGVPHVQLAIRGLPPSMRRHMFRPEYEVLYRALAQVPGVSFISNSLSAARAYAEWLDLPVGRFDIVYNGVEPMRPEPSDTCASQWDAFVGQTADATHTIGGVFRFDTDKQPLQWIRFAARYLRKHPDTRILLVGGGRLLESAQQLAAELGISERILFVGRSSRVGFWMSKMDVLILMSRYEGLPNVLIEAQYMGVRVVTTPAGGAAECLIDGTTGHVLECAEKPCLDLATERTRNLALRAGDRALFGEGGVGRHFLDSNFSIPRMLREYVTCTAGRLASLAPATIHVSEGRRVA